MITITHGVDHDKIIPGKHGVVIAGEVTAQILAGDKPEPAHAKDLQSGPKNMTLAGHDKWLVLAAHVNCTPIESARKNAFYCGYKGTDGLPLYATGS